MAVLAFVALSLLAACTTIEQATTSSQRGGRLVFATQEDVGTPYVSLGPIQATRRGVLLLGFVDAAGTDMQTVLNEDLFPEVRRLGGNGIMNVRVERTQYTIAERIMFAALFFIPMPSEVTITGEVISAAGPTTASLIAPEAPR